MIKIYFAFLFFIQILWSANTQLTIGKKAYLDGSYQFAISRFESVLEDKDEEIQADAYYYWGCLG